MVLLAANAMCALVHGGSLGLLVAAQNEACEMTDQPSLA
jgi:hypothetical protein